MISTKDEKDQPHWSAMGPFVDKDGRRLELRPFQPSRTLENLKRHPFGVFHLVDDAHLIALCAIGQLDHQPLSFAAEQINGFVLDQCCRWFEFEVDHIDIQSQRAIIPCSILHIGRRRDYRGFNRARNAIVEAAILASRIDFLPIDFIQAEYQKLFEIVKKTGGAEEGESFSRLAKFVAGDPVSETHSR